MANQPHPPSHPKTRDDASGASPMAVAFAKNANGHIEVSFVPCEAPQSYDTASLKAVLVAGGFKEDELSDADLQNLATRHARGDYQALSFDTAGSGVLLTLIYDPATRTLFAEIGAASPGEPLSFAKIKEAISEGGYGEFDISNADLSALTMKAQQKKFGRYAIGKKREYTRVALNLDESNGMLYADLSASEDRCVDNRESLQALIESSGYANFHFEPNVLDKLFAQITKNERGRYAIGQRRDAGVKIEVDETLMTAWISVSPPKGGRDLNEAIVEKAIADAGIFRGCCDDALLRQILANKSADKLIFARGTEPVDGVDAKFEALVEEVVYAAPKADKSGKINIREIVNFTLIEENVPLMRRKPAKPGVNGRDVKGHVIPAKEAVDTPFDTKLEGAAISPDDPNLLISTNKGHPVISANNVKVDNSIVLNNVDLSTGNIDYDGSVLIKGEVKPGMRVKVTGDIIVKGVVSKATLIAKNNIVVECGVIGSDPAKDGNESPPAILKAGGGITAQYINLAEISAAGDVEVKEYISHCKVSAKGKIKAGEKGGKGRIFGGSAYAQQGVFAVALGATGGIKTQITVGAPNEQVKQFELLQKSFESRQEKERKLEIMLKRLTAEAVETPHNSDITQKIMAVKKLLAELRAELKKMQAAVDQLSGHFKFARDTDIRVSSATFPNVFLAINGAEFMIRQESKGGIFIKQGADVRWMNYSPK